MDLNRKIYQRLLEVAVGVFNSAKEYFKADTTYTSVQAAEVMNGCEGFLKEIQVEVDDFKCSFREKTVFYVLRKFEVLSKISTKERHKFIRYSESSESDKDLSFDIHLDKALQIVPKMVSVGESRPYLECVCIDYKRGYVVASDGCKLSAYPVEIESKETISIEERRTLYEDKQKKKEQTKIDFMTTDKKTKKDNRYHMEDLKNGTFEVAGRQTKEMTLFIRTAATYVSEEFQVEFLQWFNSQFKGKDWRNMYPLKENELVDYFARFFEEKGIDDIPDLEEEIEETEDKVQPATIAAERTISPILKLQTDEGVITVATGSFFETLYDSEKEEFRSAEAEATFDKITAFIPDNLITDRPLDLEAIAEAVEEYLAEAQAS